jgi:hypothetical protein
MPRLLTRTLITIIMFPVAGAAYLASIGLVQVVAELVLANTGWSERERWALSALVTLYVFYGVLALVLQWLIWRGVIAWTPRRRARMRWVGIMLPVVCVVQAALWIQMVPDFEFGLAGAAFSCVFLTLIALILNFAFWTETPVERAKRMAKAGLNRTACPVCRYDLAGLTNLRCPECGSEFTFGAIVEENRRREVPSALDG